MSIDPRHLLSTLVATALLLAGCAQPSTTRPAPSRTTTVSTTAPKATVRTAPRQPATPAAPEALDNENTGITACDDYLSSYLACHRAAQIYPSEQLSARYQAMHTTLLRDSKDPAIRPQLAARCNSLATQLHQALHGTACTPEPAPATTQPSANGQ